MHKKGSNHGEDVDELCHVDGGAAVSVRELEGRVQVPLAHQLTVTLLAQVLTKAKLSS